MNNIERLWIDVTDIVSWTGNMTGIQRTVFNLGRRYKNDPRVSYFMYYADRREFGACEFPEFKSKKESNKDHPSLLSHIKMMVKKIMHMILPEFIKINLKKIYTSIMNIGRSSISNPFKHGDTVLVLGGNWGDTTKYYVDDLGEQATRLNLKVKHLVYDLLPLKYPNYFAPGSTKSYKRYIDKLSTYADTLLCISINTKKDLETYLNEKRLDYGIKLDVIKLGEDMADKGLVGKKPDSAIDNSFIVCVGTIEARKNHTLLYYVVKDAVQKNIKIPQIIIVGLRGWMTTDIQHMIDEDPDTKDKLKIIDDASDEEIVWLYQNCLFSIYPSFYEGWGLPLAEAAHYGKVCLASDSSSIPEVLGSDAVYFSPFDSQECLQKIVTYSKETKLRAEKERSLAKRKIWTWDDAHVQLDNLV